MEKQLLIAIDDSATSYLALDYVAFLFASEKDVRFRIGHCLIGESRAIPTPEDSRKSLLPDMPLGKSGARAKKCLAKGVDKLLAAGVEQERITTTTLHGADAASSILSYAEKELVDAVVVARRGVGLVGELLLGSVSSTLFDKSSSIPLWIIDGTVTSKNVLVPVDGSPQSLLAIDHLSHIFANRSDIDFYLFHARTLLSTTPVCRPADFYDKWGRDWCDKHLSGDGCLYLGPAEILTEAGIPKEKITSLPIPKSVEESSAIINCAHKNRCGTIVIGRRPASQSKGFLGGVSRRTIKQTENAALWIVG